MLDVLTIWKREYGPGAMSPVQEEVIRHIMRGRDALVVMPRGEDRELCFQVPVPAEASPENYLVRQKRLHRNAYAKWRPEDDRLLLETYRSGASVRELAALFSRNEGAIRSRLKKKGIL
jgi:DNA-directed RNA polymerase specialized sigma24 family protein